METEPEKQKVMTMAEIAEMKGALIVNQPMLIVPPEVVVTAAGLQHEVKAAAEYLESCYLVYRDCTLNHVVTGIIFQRHEDVYYWLTPADFSWGDVEKIAQLAAQVKRRESERFTQQVESSVPVHDFSSGRLLYYQKTPQLDQEIAFIVPPRLFFVDPYDWTRITANSVYHPALRIQEFAQGDELAEHQGRLLLLEVLENLRQPTPC